jgi:phosphate-selective porin OprO and OprP
MLVGLSMNAPHASGQGVKDKPVLEQLLDLLLQRGQIDREQYNALQEKAKKEQTTAVQAGIDRGRPFIRSADGNMRFDVGGRIQVDFDRAEDGARTLTGAKLGSQFLVRRARLEVNGQFFQWIDFKIESDFTDSQPLRDVYIDLKFLPELRLRGGQFKVPFSLEELTSDLHIDFVERSLVNELAPSFDRGVMGYGNVGQGVVSYFVGGFNGSGQNTSDNNGDKDVAARLVIAPFQTSNNFWLKGFQIAGDVTYGNQSTSQSAQGRTEARASNRFVYFAAQPTRGDRLRYGGDLAWLVGPAAVKFEYDVQTNERRGLGPQDSDLDKVRARGWYASATYLLTGEEKRLSAPVVPTHPFAPIAGKWGPGALELGFRYAELRFRSDDPVNFFDGNLTRIPGGGRTAENEAEALTLGVTWYPNAQTRLMFNSTTYWYDNALGTPYSCPHTCTTMSLGNLQRSHTTSWEILSRLQFFW